jgi:hypothetical protein
MQKVMELIRIFSSLSKSFFMSSDATSCRERSSSDAFWTVRSASWRSTKRATHYQSAVIGF